MEFQEWLLFAVAVGLFVLLGHGVFLRKEDVIPFKPFKNSQKELKAYVVINGEKLVFHYNAGPGARKFEQEMNDLMQISEDEAAALEEAGRVRVSEMLAEIITRWDVEDESGNVMEPTAEAIREMPYATATFHNQIVQTISEQLQNGGQQGKGRSSHG